MLSLLLLQGSGNGKGDQTTSEANVGNSSAKFAFHDHCDEIYKEKYFAAKIFAAILVNLGTRIEMACGGEEESFPLMRTIVAGNLWCKRSLSQTSDILLEYIEGDENYDCPQIDGFHGVYVQLD
ncbi:hypothetical protein ACLKA7_008261 [Drosophila subpalustris]